MVRKDHCRWHAGSRSLLLPCLPLSLPGFHPSTLAPWICCWLSLWHHPCLIAWTLSLPGLDLPCFGHFNPTYFQLCCSPSSAICLRWMSLRPVTTEDIQGLVRAIEALNVRVGLLVERVEAGTRLEAEWEVIESEVPATYPKGKELQRLSSGIAEEPPEVPPIAFALGRRLTGADIGADSRVRRAFLAGFFAKIAVETSTNYEEVPALAVSNTQWVVVRGSTLGRPVRVPSKRDLSLAISGASSPISQGFASATEAFIFCIGCGIPPPPLQKWRNHQ